MTGTSTAAPHAPADGQRNEDLIGGPSDDLEHNLALIARGRDVKEHQLVRAVGVIGAGQLHRISRVAQPQEVNTLNYPAAGDIQTWDNPDRDRHPGTSLMPGPPPRPGQLPAVPRRAPLPG